MAITKLDRSMPFWAVESGIVSDLKPPGHVQSATGCVVVAKLQHEEGTTAGPLESSMAARVVSRLAGSTPTEGKAQGYRSHVAGCPMRAEKLEPQIRFTVWKLWKPCLAAHLLDSRINVRAILTSTWDRLHGCTLQLASLI